MSRVPGAYPVCVRAAEKDIEDEHKQRGQRGGHAGQQRSQPHQGVRESILRDPCGTGHTE